MAYLNDRVLDNGLTVLDTEATRLDICTDLPATFTEATVTYTKGNKTSLSIGSPAAKDGGGRKVTVEAISDGTVTGDGTVDYWAITDTDNSRLLAAGDLSEAKAVASGNTFTLAAFDIGIPGPA